jgi:hypothetical protein
MFFLMIVFSLLLAQRIKKSLKRLGFYGSFKDGVNQSNRVDVKHRGEAKLFLVAFESAGFSVTFP